jgi:hypothetical protein
MATQFHQQLIVAGRNLFVDVGMKPLVFAIRAVPLVTVTF